MTLQQQDKNALVKIRLQKAKETMSEVKGIIPLGVDYILLQMDW